MGTRTLYLAALLSGAAGLVYQEMWARALRLSLGATSFAIGTVLAAFLGGLGLGSVLIGRVAERSRRPARLYALLEVGIAAYAPLSLPVLGVVERVHGALYEPGGGGAGLRLGLCLAALAVPTVLMGGTLPALAAALTAREDASRRAVGLAYGANTLGAMAGAVVGAFLLLGMAGMRGAILCAAAANLCAATLALLVSRSPAGVTLWERRTEHVPPDRSPVPTLLVVAAAASGASMMALEVVWTRTLSGLLGGVHHVFAVMLAVVLGGIGVGGLVYARLHRNRVPCRRDYALVALLQGAGALTLLPLAGPLADTLYRVLPGGIGFGGLLLVGAASVACVALPASLVAGIGYPMLAAIARRGGAGVARDLGILGLSSAAGSIAGALATSFWGISSIGTHACLRAAAALMACVSIAMALGDRSDGSGGRRVSRFFVPLAAALVVVVAIFPGDFPARFLESSLTTFVRMERPPDPRALAAFRLRSLRVREYVEEGIDATVVVLRTDRQRTLYVNGKPDASSWRDMGTQTLLGALPFGLRPGSRSALVVGLGSGTTAGWLAASPEMRRVDVAEIERAMVGAARLFEPFHPPALDDPRVRLVFEDGRVLVTGTGRSWDAIVSEPSNPWLGGGAALYTRDFYARARGRLGGRGVFVQWLQTYGISERALAVLVGTFTSVFRHAAMVYSGSADVLLVGSRGPLDLDPSRLGERMQALGAWDVLSARMGLASPDDLAGCVLAAGDGLRALAAPARGVVHTDDDALLEIDATRHVLRREAGPLLRIAGDAARLPSLLRALGVDGSREEAVCFSQARCLARDAPDAARAVLDLARERGADPDEASRVDAALRTPPPRPASFDEASTALGRLGRGLVVDPRVTLEIAATLTGMAERGGPDAERAISLLEDGFPDDVLFLTRAHVLLELGVARREPERCREAARTLLGANVLDPRALDLVAACLDFAPDPDLARRHARLAAVVRDLE